MNLPVGQIIKQGLNFGSGEFLQKFLSLMQEQFSGYLVVTIEGYDGLEEGAVLFKSGNPVASIYEYLKYDILVFGGLAFPRVFNAACAKNNVADLIGLENQQIDLILAFNEKARLLRTYAAKDINELSISEYSSTYAESILAEVLKTDSSKYEVLKRLGLSEIK